MKTPRVSLAKSIRLSSETVCTPGCENCDRLRTIVVRFGNGAPMDSNVFLPITMTCPVVIFLNHLKSPGKCHGILPPAPITRFSDIAVMALKWLEFMLKLVLYLLGFRNNLKLELQLNRNRRFDGRVWVVADQFEILEHEAVYGLHRGVYLHLRQPPRLAAKLLLHLIKMIRVDMKVTKRVDEVARL